MKYQPSERVVRNITNNLDRNSAGVLVVPQARSIFFVSVSTFIISEWPRNLLASGLSPSILWFSLVLFLSPFGFTRINLASESL